MKIKKIKQDATLPIYASEGAACFDLHACVDETVAIPSGGQAVIGTGLAFEVPEGYAMLVFSRSGHAFKFDTRLANCVGVIDSDYRGEVMVKLRRDPHLPPTPFLTVANGDRVAQALLVQTLKVEFELVDELQPTLRGEGGFGSTGK